MSMTPKTDWPALVGRLERYYRHAELAEACQRSERWVAKLKTGEIQEPTHWAGEVLRDMDRDLTERLAVQAASSIPTSILGRKCFM